VLANDGTTWTTDKDGVVMSLLAAELMARLGRDPSKLYAELAEELGDPVYARIDAPLTPDERSALAALSPDDLTVSELGDDPIEAVLTAAPGNGAPIGGLKVVTAHGWIAARPSGTEAIYKLYAESFRGPEHLRLLQNEAQALVSRALAATTR
jgi:phosphoglucomutase